MIDIFVENDTDDIENTWKRPKNTRPAKKDF